MLRCINICVNSDLVLWLNRLEQHTTAWFWHTGTCLLAAGIYILAFPFIKEKITSYLQIILCITRTKRNLQILSSFVVENLNLLLLHCYLTLSFLQWHSFDAPLISQIQFFMLSQISAALFSPLYFDPYLLLHPPGRCPWTHRGDQLHTGTFCSRAEDCDVQGSFLNWGNAGVTERATRNWHLSQKQLARLGWDQEQPWPTPTPVKGSP